MCLNLTHFSCVSVVKLTQVYLKMKLAKDFILFFRIDFYMKLSFFRAHFDSLIDYIERGKKEGAKLVYGGKRVGDKGNQFHFH